MLKGIRGFLSRELRNAERAAEMVRAQRLVMAASVAGLRAELAMLQSGGSTDLTENTRRKLAELIMQMETFDRDVAQPAELRRLKAIERASRFEAFVDRVIAA